MSVLWPGYANDAGVLLRRDLEATARMLASISDMNVQGARIASLDSVSQAEKALIRITVLPIHPRRDFSPVGDLSLPFVDHASHPFAIQIVRLAFSQCKLQLPNGFTFLSATVDCQCHLNPQHDHLRILLNRVCPKCLRILPHRQMFRCQCQTCGK